MSPTSSNIIWWSTDLTWFSTANLLDYHRMSSSNSDRPSIKVLFLSSRQRQGGGALSDRTWPNPLLRSSSFVRGTSQDKWKKPSNHQKKCENRFLWWNSIHWICFPHFALDASRVELKKKLEKKNLPQNGWKLFSGSMLLHSYLPLWNWPIYEKCSSDISINTSKM